MHLSELLLRDKTAKQVSDMLPPHTELYADQQRYVHFKSAANVTGGDEDSGQPSREGTPQQSTTDHNKAKASLDVLHKRRRKLQAELQTSKQEVCLRTPSPTSMHSEIRLGRLNSVLWGCR